MGTIKSCRIKSAKRCQLQLYQRVYKKTIKVVGTDSKEINRKIKIKLNPTKIRLYSSMR